MLHNASTGNIQAITNLAVFELILEEKEINKTTLSEKLLTNKETMHPEEKEEKLFENMDETKHEQKQDKNDLLFTKKIKILEYLNNLYKKEEKHSKLQEQIGIFMAGLALKDKEFASIIFEPTWEFYNIIKKECLTSSSQYKTLFYEAMVNSFEWDITDSQANTIDQLFNLNSNMIINMHRALHPKENFNDEEIIKSYKIGETLDFWKLCQLQEQFIKQCISKGSAAEKKLKQFFTAFVFFPDSKEAEEMQRNLILESYQHFSHTKAPYIELLAENKEITHLVNRMWEKETERLKIEITKNIENTEASKLLFFNELDKNKNSITAAQKIQIEKKFDELIKQMRDLLNQLGNRINLLGKEISLVGKKKDKLPNRCYLVKHNLTLLQDKATKIMLDILEKVPRENNDETKEEAKSTAENHQMLIKQSPPPSPASSASSTSSLFSQKNSEVKSDNSRSPRQTPQSPPQQTGWLGWGRKKKQ